MKKYLKSLDTINVMEREPADNAEELLPIIFNS